MLETAFSIDDLATRTEWLQAMEETLEELERLRANIQQHVKGDVE